MAFIYNLTDTWNDATTTWNGIKLAVTDTGSSAASKLLNLTISGSSTGYFYVDKSGNLTLSGSVNKITMTAPATGATFTLADGSSLITVGAFSSTFTFTGTTALTFPTSGTVTALGNTTTGSGNIVLATSPTLTTPNLGVPTAVTLTNGTGLPLSTGVTGTLSISNGGTGQTTANAAFNALAPSQTGNNGKYLTTDGTNTSWATNPLGTVTSVDVSGGSTGLSFSGGPITTSGTITMAGTLAVANGGTGLTSLGTGVATALGVNVGSAGAFVVNGGALGTPSSGTLTNATGLPISTGVSGLGTGVATFLATPSSANLASAVTDETGSGPLVFATSPTFTSAVTLGTQSTTRGSLVLANTTAGSKAVTLQSSNSTAAAYTLTFPAAAPVNGYYLQTDNLGQLSWAAGGGGGGGSPGGSNTQVQFNDAATFGGAAAFTYDKTTYTLGLGVASTSSGTFNIFNSTSAYKVSLKSGANAADWSLTLPTGPGTNGYVLSTDGTGATAWIAGGGTLTVGTTGISGGTTGRILYDNAGVLGEKTVTGTGDVVLATSPTLVTPLLGTPTSGTLTNCTGYTVGNLSGLGTGVATAAANAVNTAGGLLAPAAALTANALVVGGGSGTGPSTVTTGTGVVTALGINTGSAGAFVVNGGALGTPSSGALTNCTSVPVNQATGTLPVANGGTGLTSGTSGGVLYYSATGTLASSAALAASALVVGGGAGVAPSTVTTGTGVVTALGVNTGSAGAFVVNGGALGTPSSGALTNCTSVPVNQATGTLAVANGGTGITSFGTGVATWLGTPSSANLAAAVTDETGTGALVFGTNPTITNYTEAVVAIGNTGTLQTLSLTSGTVQTATLTGNCTFTMPTNVAGKSFVLILNTGSSAYTATFSSVKWPNNTAPTITAGSSTPRWDILSFFADGTNWYGSFVQAFQ